MNKSVEHTITDSVIERLASTPDPRLKQIMMSLVKHLHAFIREVEPTEQEWFRGIQFLTETGQKCDAKRQEFIILSDTLGVSMLVNAINHRAPGGATESTVLGPFYLPDAPELPLGARIGRDADGPPAVISGKVTTPEGKSIANAQLDVWMTSNRGLYDVQDPTQPEMNLRGRFRTDREGRYEFIAVKPLYYPVPTDGPVGKMLLATGRHPYRPAHIHVIASAEGFKPVTTHIFVKGDSYLASDAVFGVKNSLVADFVEHDSAQEAARYKIKAPFFTAQFDIGLAPA
jgi:protocatechuate 3,4-dioxygenase beta subunit